MGRHVLFSQDTDCLTNNLDGGLPAEFGNLDDINDDEQSIAIDNILHYLMSKDKPILIAESAPKYFHTGNLTYKPARTLLSMILLISPLKKFGINGLLVISNV